ncbi:hypothetical protein SCHPADRAFT_897499, partial [Schizopora paradoxa]
TLHEEEATAAELGDLSPDAAVRSTQITDSRQVTSERSSESTDLTPYGLPRLDINQTCLPNVLCKQILNLRRLHFTPEVIQATDSFTADPRLVSKNALSNLRSGWTMLGNHDNRTLQHFLSAKQHWIVLMHGAKFADAMTLHACILRAQHMLGQWLWWASIREEVPIQVDSVLQGDVSDHWIHILISFIHKQFQNAPGSREQFIVSFADVFPSSDSGLHTSFFEASLGQTSFVMEAHLRSSLVLHTSEVIAQWIGLTGTERYENRNSPIGSWDSRGWFIDAVLRLGHPGLLLLPEIHSVFNWWRIPGLSHEDASRVTDILQRVFGSDKNQDMVSLRCHLDDVLSQFMPDMQHMFTVQQCLLPLSITFDSDTPSTSPTPNPLTDSLAEDADSVAIDDEEYPANIVAAGEALINYLQDIEPLYGLTPPQYFKSKMPKKY